MSDWQTDTGLFSDYEGTVTDAWFQTDPNVGDGKVYQLYLEMGDIDQPTPDGKGEWVERYSLGPDWSSSDGGKTVTHPSKNLFNKNSQVGRLIDKLVELAGTTVTEKGSPKVAATFLGARMFMEGVTTSGTFRQGVNKGEKWESTRNFPSRFLGFVDGPVVASSNGAKVKPGIKDGAGWVEYLADSAFLPRIKELAAEVDNAMALVGKCVDIPGLMDDNALVTALAEDGVGSLFAVLKG